MCVCAYMYVLCLCRDWFCGLTWERVCIWEVLDCVCLLMTEFDCPEVTVCSWQDVKIQWLTNQEREREEKNTALTWCTAYCLYIDKCRRFFFGQCFSPLLLKLFLALSAQASPAVPCCTQWNVHLEQLGLASQPVKCSLGTVGPGFPACVKCSLGTVGPGIPACEMFIGNSWAWHPSLWNVHWEQLGQASQPVWNVHWKSWARHSSLCEMFIVNSRARHPNVCVCELLIGNIWARHPSLCEMFIGNIWARHPSLCEMFIGNIWARHLSMCEIFIGNIWARHPSLWYVYREEFGQSFQCVKCSLGTVGPGIPACVKCGTVGPGIGNGCPIRSYGTVGPVVPVCEIFMMFIGNSWARHPSSCVKGPTGTVGLTRFSNMCFLAC